MAGGADFARNHAEITPPMAYSQDDSAHASSTDALVHDPAFDGPAPRPRHAQGPALAHDADRGRGSASPPARSRWSPICCGRPGERDASSDPARLPVSVGGTLFNVPTAAIRMKIQRHSGPQERVDLYFVFPSLEPPDAPKHVSADTVEEKVQPIDRIFLSISAHHDTLAPDTRVAHDLSALSRAGLDAGRRRTDDARVPRRLALCQRGSVLCQHAGPQRALHARRPRRPACA